MSGSSVAAATERKCHPVGDADHRSAGSDSEAAAPESGTHRRYSRSGDHIPQELGETMDADKEVVDADDPDTSVAVPEGQPQRQRVEKPRTSDYESSDSPSTSDHCEELPSICSYDINLFQDDTDAGDASSHQLDQEEVLQCEDQVICLNSHVLHLPLSTFKTIKITLS